MTTIIKAAIVQETVLPLAVTEGLDRAVGHVKAAIEAGAQVIAFGETFLGGYPAWLEHVPGPALWDHPGTRELHGLLLAQAIRGDDPRFKQLQWVVDIAGVIVSIGAIERVRSSLFNSQLLFRPKQPVLRHRKLLPTPSERMLFGSGDGSTIEMHEAPWGRVGQLVAGEHWMPLARATMHHVGEAVHVAAWPTVHDISLLASAHYAYEGRSFVLAAGTLQRKEDMLRGYVRAGGDGPGRELIDRLPGGWLQRGGSAIIAPDGVTIAQADDEATILTATLDLGEVEAGRFEMDIGGLSARPDVFELRVDRRPRKGIVDVEDDGTSEAA
jgi:predicted amidohydrolase